jgi:hypothetical protein
MNCRVCGRQFDPEGFQVMVPGLKHGFDRVDCALEAITAGPPPSQSTQPVPAVVRALPTAVAPLPALAGGPPVTVQAASVRPHLLASANLALIAAGTAATIYLWLRVFGADAGPFAFPAANESDAYGRTTVTATIDLTPQPVIRPEPENTVRTDPGLAPAGPSVTDDGGGGGTLVSNRRPGKERPSGGSRGPVARPAPNPPPAPPPSPPSEPTPTRSAPVPTNPVPSSPPDDRVPGPTLPGGSNPEQPSLPGSGRP